MYVSLVTYLGSQGASEVHCRASVAFYFVHGLNNVILVSVLLLDISIKSGGYSESFFNPAASLFLK